MYGETKYEGLETLVVTMDIGTTQSAVSFAHLTPGCYTETHTVVHWPGERYSSQYAKTPSMVSYRNGIRHACGTEALRDFEECQENVAYWFKLKLHLHPASTSQSNSSELEIPPLPVGIAIERVYADMMEFLMKHTQWFFEKYIPNGAEIWARLRDTIVIVLATPNEWYVREQATLRKAAIIASLVTEENAAQLLQFVTEAEASVHYMLAQRPLKWLQKKTIFAVMDCGGSTVDTTVYRCGSTHPLRLNETCRSECVQIGGVFVDRALKKTLERRLKGSSFSGANSIQKMVNAFERGVKTEFDGVTDNYTLKFGSPGDNDAGVGIFEGRITFSNEELTAVFNPVINQIVKRCSKLILNQKAEYVLVVGGFGESPYLRKVLGEELADHDRDLDLEIIQVGDSVKKAAAEGAVIGYIKQFVVARVARATFGGCVRQKYDKKLHRERSHAVQIYADGKKRVDGVFHTWVTKGAVLQGTFAYKLPYHVAWNASTSKSELSLMLGTIEIEVFAWEGDGIPTWCKDENGEVMRGMRLICTLNADLSSLAGVLKISNGPRGKRFYRVDYNVCVYFGGTQLRAKLQWKEQGVLREGPVAVMPYVS